MPQIQQVCDELLGRMLDAGKPVAELLAPGISEEEVCRLTAGLPFKLPKSVVDLYSWRNGTLQGKTSFGAMWWYPCWFFVSLPVVLEIYEGLIRDRFHFWDNDCFPIFWSGGSDYLGIRCEEGPTDDGEIVIYQEGDSETTVEFSSLEAMLRTLSACYKTGVIEVTVGGDSILDQVGFAEVAARFNPNLKRWHQTK